MRNVKSYASVQGHSWCCDQDIWALLLSLAGGIAAHFAQYKVLFVLGLFMMLLLPIGFDSITPQTAASTPDHAITNECDV